MAVWKFVLKVTRGHQSMFKQGWMWICLFRRDGLSGSSMGWEVEKKRPRSQMIHICYHFNWERCVKVTRSSIWTEGKLESESKPESSSDGGNVKGNQKAEIGAVGGWWASWLRRGIQKGAVGKIDLVLGTDILETLLGPRYSWDVRLRWVKPPRFDGFFHRAAISIDPRKAEGSSTGQNICRNWGNFSTSNRTAPPRDPSALGVYFLARGLSALMLREESHKWATVCLTGWSTGATVELFRYWAVSSLWTPQRMA